MDWNNINLESAYERDQNIIDPLNFDILILEVYSNYDLKNISESTVKEQFEKDLKNRIISAREVFESNLKNIVKQVRKEKK